MRQAHLLRTEQIADGTFGLLELRGANGTPELRLHTMEDDWRDNAPNVSCIPAGTYRCARTLYHRHGYETFEVTGVPGRSRILIHPANTEEDVQGCIGVGLRPGYLTVARDEDTGETRKSKRAVVASREAFRQLMAHLADVDEFELTITWGIGLPRKEAA
jgi:hypothetical protein